MTWLDEKPTKQQRRSRFLKEEISRIKAGGMTSHSARGATLQILIEYLEQEKVSYQLTAHPGCGYMIKGIPPLYNNTET